MPGPTPFARLAAAAFLAAAICAAQPAHAGPRDRDDALLRRGYDLLSSDRPGAAREALRRIDVRGYDLGDYALFLIGLSHARENDRPGAARALSELSASFPASPLVPYLSLEVAFLDARENDLASARVHLSAARGKVNGNGRKTEEGYVAARILEEDGPPGAAAEAHLANFAASPASEGASLSMERLWAWRSEGKLKELGLPVAFYGKFARALARASETEKARSVYRQALEEFSPSEDYYAVLLDYAEFLRKIGETARSREVLDRALPDAPPSFRLDVEFLRARVDWKAGRLRDARAKFLAIADNDSRPPTAEQARYLAAWIAEEEGDVAALTEEFGKLRNASSQAVRVESAFRHAFGLYRLGRHEAAAAAFAQGERSDFSSVERARNRFWRAKALFAAGRKDEGGALMEAVAADPGAGPYALFAARESGRNPYAMLDAPADGETAACGRETAKLWELVRGGKWAPEDALRVKRAERLVGLGIVEYAVLEAQAVSPASARAAIGLADGAAGGLFRYLAGDLRGAIRETKDVPNDPAAVELVDRIQYPLAPGLVGDCEAKKSGIDPLVLHAIIRQESQFFPGALSPAGAIGLMQLLPRTAAETARKEKMRRPKRADLLRPQINVRLGAAYLGRLLRAYEGDYVRAVAAYNAGEAAVSRWWESAGGDPALFLEKMTYRETRFYVRRVFLNLLQYYLIYRPQAFARHFPSAPGAAPPARGGAASPPIAASDAAPSGAGPAPAGAVPFAPPPPPPPETPGSIPQPAPAPR